MADEYFVRVKQALAKITTIAFRLNGERVERTVAEELSEIVGAQVEVVGLEAGEDIEAPGVLRVAVVDEAFGDLPVGVPEGREWNYLRLEEDGSGLLLASQGHLLYGLCCRIRDEWLDLDAAEFAEGRWTEASFNWLGGRDELLTGRLGFLRKRTERMQEVDLEEGMRELARLGCSHVVVNELAQAFPHESGPNGEIYFRFYAYLPDLDQFVESKLNRGSYPREYLEGNLNLLKRQAKLADKYGLTPGMNIANPRSVPDSLLERYPFLRGARVDHTFRSYRPRYTLSLAHPAVRWHYAELLRTILQEVPELGFVQTLINDSGSGFEYTASLYPGRNGGPYVVREWRSDEEVARAAAENIIRYYRLLRDVARETHPHFRIVTGLKNIAEEAEIILDGMDDGIDRQMLSQRSDVDDSWQETLEKLRAKGSELLAYRSARGSAYVLGIPCPWWTRENLEGCEGEGFDRVDVDLDPSFLVQRDINREVVGGFQLDRERSVDELVEKIATRWVGEERMGELVEIWRLLDRIVREAPMSYLYSGLGFTWYRFWVRPFVPDIGAIPEGKRAYYEKYMLCIFNNPHFVDFGADALWEIHGAEEARGCVEQFEGQARALLDRAVALADQAAVVADEHRPFFGELRDRTRAYRHYCVTMRNLFAWGAGVHGYLEGEEEAEKKKALMMVQEMVESELRNSEELLALWERSAVDFMPIHEVGESMHDYGLNFGELVGRKIELMRKYGNRTPRIDPNFMWRMPEGAELKEEDYLGY